MHVCTMVHAGVGQPTSADLGAMAPACERYAFEDLESTLTVWECKHNGLSAPLSMMNSITTWKEISCRGTEDFRLAPLVFGLWFRVPAAEVKEFDRWYEEEHTPMLLKCADWWSVRRFERLPLPDDSNRFVLHYLGAPDALESKERVGARSTNMAKRILAQEWFQCAPKHVLRRLARD